MTEIGRPSREPSSGWRAARRRIWQPPVRIQERRSQEHSVQFLELFYDLVFVVLVAQLAHRLSEHPSWSGFGWFGLLLFAVWTSWLNGSYYHDAHGTDDLSIRILTFSLMITVAVMAVFAGDIPGEGASGFALAYAANSALLAAMWFRAGYHDVDHRPNSTPGVVAYAIATGLFVVSAFTAEPAIYWIWAVALIIETLGAVPAIRNWRPNVPTAATPSLIERFGLFIIIVLGEAVAGAINGMVGHQPVTSSVVTIGVVGMLVAIGLWWLYFDLVSHRTPRARAQFVWGYLHFPLVLGIAASGAAILATIEQVGEPLSNVVRWLLFGSISLAMVTIVAIAATLVAQPENRQIHLTASVTTLVSAGLMTVGGFTSFDTMGTLTVAALLLLTPVAISVFVWATVANFASADDSAV